MINLKMLFVWQPARVPQQIDYSRGSEAVYHGHGKQSLLLLDKYQLLEVLYLAVKKCATVKKTIWLFYASL